MTPKPSAQLPAGTEETSSTTGCSSTRSHSSRGVAYPEISEVLMILIDPFGSRFKQDVDFKTSNRAGKKKFRPDNRRITFSCLPKPRVQEGIFPNLYSRAKKCIRRKHFTRPFLRTSKLLTSHPACFGSFGRLSMKDSTPCSLETGFYRMSLRVHICFAIF